MIAGRFVLTTDLSAEEYCTNVEVSGSKGVSLAESLSFQV